MNYYVPKDLVDTKDYYVGPDMLCDDYRFVERAKEAVKGKTLGEAMEALYEMKDIKVLIRMPVPHKPPWREKPALLIRERKP